MQKRLFFTIVTCFLYCYNLKAADAPKYSNEFLSVGVGARALGMGGSSVSTGVDVGAAYWNPALLINLSTPMNASLMHAEYFAGVAKYDFGGFAYKLDTTTSLAVSFVRFGVDNIPNTIELIDKDGNISYDRLSYFSTSDYALLFSLAKKTLGGKVNVGANAKIIYRNVGKFANAFGFGFDVGAQMMLGNYSLGLMLRDITTTFNVWTYNGSALEIPSYVLPSGDTITNAVPDSKVEITLPKISFGVSRTFDLGKEFSLLAEVALDINTDGQRNTLISSSFLNIDPKVGIEAGYKKMVFLRAGVNNMQRITQFDNKKSFSIQPNIGIGISIKGFTLDYALTNIGATGVSTYSNIFSLSYAF